MRIPIIAMALFGCAICSTFGQDALSTQITVSDEESQLRAELRSAISGYQAALAANQAALAIQRDLTVDAREFMNPAANPNLLHYDELDRDSLRLGDGTRIPLTGIIFRSALTGTAISRFDSGFVGSGAAFNSGTIEPNSRRSRFFDMTNGSANLVLDLEKQIVFASGVPGEAPVQAQAFLDADLLGDGTNGGAIEVRNAFARLSVASGINILAGQYWTTWGDEGTIPKSIGRETATASSVFVRVPQIRFAVPVEENWLFMLAVQKPLTGGIDPRDPRDIAGAPPTPNTVLQRWPDLAMRLHHYSRDQYSTFSIGAILRGVGIETQEGREHLKTAWGVSGNARIKLDPCGTHAVQFGVVGGSGIAGDIFGLSSNRVAATSVPPNSFSLRESYGAFGGLSYRPYENLKSNIAYGFARADAVTSVSSQFTQSAWANIIYQFNDAMSVGLEYGWGENNTSGSSEGNHRFTLAVSVSPQASKSKDAAETQQRLMRKLPVNNLPEVLQPRQGFGPDAQRTRSMEFLNQAIAPEFSPRPQFEFRRL